MLAAFDIPLSWGELVKRTLADLSFGVPDAIVQLAGTYDVKKELLDFRCYLLLDASLAERPAASRRS